MKPELDPVLTDFCTELTGITQKDVDGGVSLQEALVQVHNFLYQEGVFGSEFVFLSCGDFDGGALKREAEKKDIYVPNYLKRWINIKRIPLE